MFQTNISHLISSSLLDKYKLLRLESSLNPLMANRQQSLHSKLFPSSLKIIIIIIENYVIIISWFEVPSQLEQLLIRSMSLTFQSENCGLYAPLMKSIEYHSLPFPFRFGGYQIKSAASLSTCLQKVINITQFTIVCQRLCYCPFTGGENRWLAVITLY